MSVIDPEQAFLWITLSALLVALLEMVALGGLTLAYAAGEPTEKKWGVMVNLGFVMFLALLCTAATVAPV